MSRFEAHCGKLFSRVIAVSPRDKLTLKPIINFPMSGRLRRLLTPPTFLPKEGNHNTSPVGFVGSMDWQPNRHGIKHFAYQILPRVRAKFPDIQLIIVGRNPPADIRSMEHLPGVVVTGTVEDTRPFLRRASMSIVPLYMGGGTRLKIFEAMASGVPVVSTPLGVEGLDVQSEEHLAIADSDEQFALAIMELLAYPQKANAMAERAFLHVTKKFGSEGIARQLRLYASKPWSVMKGGNTNEPESVSNTECVAANFLNSNSQSILEVGP